MKKRWLCTILALLLALSAGLLGACAPKEDPGDGSDITGPGDDDDNKDDDDNPDPPVTQAYTMPSWSGRMNETDVSVHDPSIFYDEASSTYYAFGTHFAVASSTDLINWTQVASDNQPQVLYGNEMMSGSYSSFPAAIADTVNLVRPTASGSKAVTTTWAPDVEYYNGKYYMYYSLTKAFGSRESAIARVEADSVTGPYSNNVAIVDSMGGGGSDPNCIDPELFYDKDGKLWMVYGSFFGGIYIKELYNEGENWGLPKEDGYGTRLWGNNSSNMEGPFIFYNEATDYYYLMTSHGDLSTVYNMRVARSKNPDGPYEDITGAEMAGNAQGGNKLAGNYVMGEAYSGAGYAAIGHNSVVEVDGEYFVVAHVRRQSGLGNGVTPGHNLYVFQLYFNEDGWPVMNPNRYAGESLGTGMTAEKLAGTYDVVVHSEGTTVNFVQSVAYTFNADGTITDAQEANVGTWALSEDYYVTITLGSGDSAVAYKGVATPCWDMYVRDYTQQFANFSFTATSSAGRSLWAVGTTAKT